MARNDNQIELTKPNLEKVKLKILNTAKCAAEQPSNGIVAGNLKRLTTKYPIVAENLADHLAKIADWRNVA